MLSIEAEIIIMAGQSLKEKLRIDDLYNRLLALEAKERMIIYLVLGVLIFFIVLLPNIWATSKLSKMEDKIVSHKKNLMLIMDNIQEYQSLKSEVEYLNKRVKSEGQIKFRTLLPRLGSSLGVDVNLRKTDSKKVNDDFLIEQADARINKISMIQLVEFLTKIESSKKAKFKVNQLKIKTLKDPAFVQAEFKVSVLVKKK